MRRSLWAIVAGLGLAILVAAFFAKVFGLPLATAAEGETGLTHLLRTILPVAAFVLPGALTAIALAEARRVRGLAFWVAIGALLAALGFTTLTAHSAPDRALFLSAKTFVALMAMGVAGGWIYWSIAGKHAGQLTAAVAREGRHGLSEDDESRRCRWCSILGLLAGLIPLALLGWSMIYRPAPMAPVAIARKAEADAVKMLTAAGLPETKLSIENHVGHVLGAASDAQSRTIAFDKAKAVLAPMVGLPGVVAYLQNDIAVAGTGAPAPTDGTAEAARVAALEDAKSKADEDAAKAKLKADEEARVAAEAKAAAEKQAQLAAAAHKKAEEDAAKAMAAAEARAAEERLAAETKRQAEEDAAKAKAESEARQRAEDEKRLAEDLAAQRRNDDAARLAAEVEAERKAVDAARKAESEKTAAQKLADAAPPPEPAAPSPAPNIVCASDFSDLFRSFSIRFPLRSAQLDGSAVAYLDQVAALAKRCNGFSLTIGGHADRSGAEAFNLNISDERALAVSDALVDRGIDKERLDVAGYGSQRPFIPAISRQAVALNRRVDFGASLTPPPKATTVAKLSATLENSTVKLLAPPAIAAEQCPGEFSRLFLSDVVRFAGSSDDVTDEHAEFLDHLAGLMMSCPGFALDINGHTDRRGNAAFNQSLSERRAAAVRDALSDRGIADGRLAKFGYAGERPVLPANTPEAYALNRRVDFGVHQLTVK